MNLIQADYLDHPDLVQGPLEVALAAAEESPEDQVHDDDEEEKDQAEGEAGLHSRLEESRLKNFLLFVDILL